MTSSQRDVSSSQAAATINLLEAAEAWSETELEARHQEVIQYTHTVLLDDQTDHELRLDCVRWLSERLGGFVPVYEAEDQLYCPLLTGVADFLSQVYGSICRTEESNRVMLLAVASALIDHTASAVNHATKYEGVGFGEIPSLPTKVTKILHTTFEHCSSDPDFKSSDEVKASVIRLLTKSRHLLDSLISLVDKLHIRAVLEDELEILLELCSDLVNLHPVLVTLDLKSTLRVWHLYGKLTKDHADRLRSRLDVGNAAIVLFKEGNETFVRLYDLADENKDDTPKKINRCVVTLSFIVRMTQSLSECFRFSLKSEFGVFCRFLQNIFDKGVKLLPVLSQQVRDKLNRDVYLTSCAIQLISNLPEPTSFYQYLSLEEESSQNSFLHVRISVYILEHTDGGGADPAVGELLNVLLRKFGNCIEDIHRAPELDGIEILGSPVVLVNNYDWVLTRACSYISTISAAVFPLLEETLLHSLLSPDHLTCQLAADIWCFVGRYETSALCLAHLETISWLYLQFEQASFSTQKFWLGSLIGRMFNFLGSAERRLWLGQFSPVEEENNIHLMANLNLEVIVAGDPDNTQLIRDIVLGKLVHILEQKYESYPFPVLTSCLTILAQLEATDRGRMAVLVWRKLAEGEFAPFPAVWLADFLHALSDLTCSAVPCLDLGQLAVLVASMRQVARLGEERCAYMFWGIFRVIRQMASLELIKNVEVADNFFLEEFASLCNISCRVAVREPVLLDFSLSILRLIAETSNNSAFIRKCVDEKLVMPHFTLFLKSENRSAVIPATFPSLVENAWESRKALLANLVNSSDDADGETELKRKVSRGSKSKFSPNTKRAKYTGESEGQMEDDEEGDDGDGDRTVEESVASLERETDQLVAKLGEDNKENCLKLEYIQRLEQIRNKLDSLLRTNCS